MNVMVTGAAGMIGRQVVSALVGAGYTVVGVDRAGSEHAGAKHVVMDLEDKSGLEQLISAERIDRVVHLAALAHANGGEKPSWQQYYHANVECAEHVFEVARNLPVLFVSTVDVYGFTDETVNADSDIHPVTLYGKSKAMAEEACRRICSTYTIFRFQPVYTEQIKRDIQKRYYLRYPNWAYLVGSGTEYEVLDVKVAAQKIVEWCSEEPRGETRIIKNEALLFTPDCIAEEQKAGRARHVIRFPRWLINGVYRVARGIAGENKYTYLLSKVVSPLRTE